MKAKLVVAVALLFVLGCASASKRDIHSDEDLLPGELTLCSFSLACSWLVPFQTPVSDMFHIELT